MVRPGTRLAPFEFGHVNSPTAVRRAAGAATQRVLAMGLRDARKSGPQPPSIAWAEILNSAGDFEMLRRSGVFGDESDGSGYGRAAAVERRE